VIEEWLGWDEAKMAESGITAGITHK
jgi:hypothetical protein